MKKFIYAFSTLLVLLTSCSRDEDSSPANNNPVLLKKVILSQNLGMHYERNFTYNGNKIVKAVDADGQYVNYTYTGDVITKIQTYDTRNALLETITYTYNTNNQLSSALWLLPGYEYGSKEIYTYNANGTVSVISYRGDLVTQNTLESNQIVEFQNGNVSTITTNDVSGGTSTTVYTHDTKNSPLKNILGFQKLAIAESKVGPFEFGASNNITSWFVSRAVTPTYTETNNYTNTYTYNINDFPLVQTQKTYWDEVYTTQYFY